MSWTKSRQPWAWKNRAVSCSYYGRGGEIRTGEGESRSDLRAFAQLCETLATANVLQAAIEAEGVLIKTGTGSFKTNPAQRSLETARNQAARLYTEFGLTPKARNYVSRAPDPSRNDPWGDDEFE